MQYEINRKKSVKFMRIMRMTKYFLVLLLAMPFSALAGDWDRAPANGKVTIMFPKESARVILMPHDPPVTVQNAWYYVDISFSGTPSWYNERVTSLLKPPIDFHRLQRFLNVDIFNHPNINMSGVDFFSAKQPKPVTVNPGRGQTITKTWKNCYTKVQLEEAKKDLVAWAHYMKDTWLPEHGYKPTN